MKKKIIIGYTAGVFDLFHIGHVKVLKKAKSLCDKLIVGVSTDSLVKKYKNKKPIIPFNERVEVIKNNRCVDLVVSQKFKADKRVGSNNSKVLLVGIHIVRGALILNI